jgi:hypothetical protein
MNSMTSSESGQLVAQGHERKRFDWAYALGFWSALIATFGGVVYMLVLGGAILTGQLALPPAGSIQLFGGVSRLLLCPLLVIVFACLHSVAPEEKKAFSQISLAFALMFAMAVSINRFTQLGVVRQSVAAGTAAGIEWFQPYGEHSIMFGLEMLGWGWFLGLAMIFAAPLFWGGTLHTWPRWLSVLYGVLALLSAVAFLLSSPLAAIGFVAWGPVLFVITALLAVYFRRSPSRATRA